MKRITAFVLCVIILLTLTGCGTSKYNFVAKKDGKMYVVLPISGDEILFDEKYEIYLDKMDEWLLKAAEAKLLSEAAEYADDLAFYIAEKDDALYLYGETIVELDPSETTDDECGDHEHKVFKEKITQ